MKLALVLATIGSLSTAAVAAPKAGKVDPKVQQDADKKFVDGQTAYTQGRYQDAIQLFKDAYDLVRDPVYLFNIAQSYRKVADCVPAHEYYVKYLDELPDAQNKDKVKQWIVELKPCVDKARERENEAAQAQEYRDKQRREAEGRNELRPPPPEEPYETEVDRGAPIRVAGIALAGVGILGVVVGVVYGVKGNGIESDIHDMCTAPNTCLWDSQAIQDLHDDGESANTRAKIGYIGGGVALAVGIGLYMFGRTRVETVTVTPTSGGATAGVSLRF